MNSRIVGAVTSATITVAALVFVPQPTAEPARARHTASLTFSRAPIGQSVAGAVDLTPAVATFRPVHRGARVVVQRRSGHRWVKVASGAQSAKGTFSFRTRAGSAAAPFVFRAGSRASKRARWVYGAAIRPSYSERVWGDEFSGTTLGSAWEHRGVDERAGRRMCAVVRPEQTSVSVGSARLSVARATSANTGTGSCKQGQYVNASIDTSSSHRFLYGTFAARIRFPAARGEHGGLWLQADAPAGASPGNPGVNGAEIDVAEFYGAGRSDGGLSTFVHWTTRSAEGTATVASVGGIQPSVKTILGKGRTPANGFHVYSVEWTPTSYVFRVDGVITFQTTTAVSHREEYVALSLLTSDWELPALDVANLPTRMDVDWVRVWQQ